MNHQHNENIPGWARGIDSYGRRHWHDEKKMRSRTGEYIGAIISNLVFMWIVNKVPSWNIPFIKDSYLVVIWVLNMNILVQIGANGAMLVFDYPVVRRLARILAESSGFVTTMVLYFIYPFDFHNFHGFFWMDWLLPLIFIISMVVSALKVLSNLWKLIFWRD